MLIQLTKKIAIVCVLGFQHVPMVGEDNGMFLSGEGSARDMKDSMARSGRT